MKFQSLHEKAEYSMIFLCISHFISFLCNAIFFLNIYSNRYANSRFASFCLTKLFFLFSFAVRKCQKSAYKNRQEAPVPPFLPVFHFQISDFLID